MKEPALKPGRPHPEEGCGRVTQIAALVAVVGLHLLILAVLLASVSSHASSAEATPVMVQIELAPAAPSAVAEPSPALPARSAPARRSPSPPKPQAHPEPPAPARPTVAEPGPAPALPSSHAAPAVAPATSQNVGPEAAPAAVASVAPRTSAAEPRLISAAQYLRAPVLEYPGVSRRFGEEGRVLLRVLIGTEGVALEVQVEQGSGHARLDAAAIQAARGALYRPQVVDGQARAVWVRVPLNFSLKGRDS